MIDARKQIATELKSVCPNVKMTKPDGVVTLPLICYALMEDTILNVAYDRLRWRVAVYAETFVGMLDLVKQVDAKMEALGYTRTYETPDTDSRIDTSLYLKRLDYQALVNKQYFTVVKGSK